MRTMPSKVLMSVFSLIVCAGCSVKEDRTLCPCRLVLDFSEVDTAVIRSVDLDVTAPDGFVFAENVEASRFYEDYVATVPRQELQLSVWSGRGAFASDDGLRIPYGNGAPPVYIHSALLDADCEQLHHTVIMRKNHCNVTIRMKGEDVDPVSISLVGNVDGYALDGRPTLGRFCCSSVVGVDGSCTMVLPRQVDNTLMMELDDASGVLKRFAIGEYIAESGYDWATPDLEDITIDLDFAVTHLTLVIQGWEKEYMFDIVI